MEIKSISILGGTGKDGSKESVERLDMNPGDILFEYCRSGYCGKTSRLINRH